MAGDRDREAAGADELVVHVALQCRSRAGGVKRRAPVAPSAAAHERPGRPEEVPLLGCDQIVGGRFGGGGPGRGEEKPPFPYHRG